MMRLLLALTLAVAALAAPSLAPAQTAAEHAYQKCVACHLPDGRGIPGAFPPFRDETAGFARAPAGRDYLVSVIDGGVAGPMTVGGVTYRGFMPAVPGMSDEVLAATLNYLMTEVTRASDSAPFTAAEVKAIRGAAGTRTAQQSHALRPASP